MPGRYIREGINTSDRVDALSEGAEIFFRRLLHVVDDHGRYYANPLHLFSGCYPLKVDDYSPDDTALFIKKIVGYIQECLQTELIVVYGGGKYLQVEKFQQQARYKSKFPEPEMEEYDSSLATVKPPLSESLATALPKFSLNDNDNDNKKENKQKKKKWTLEEAKNTPVPESLNTPEFITEWHSWLKHLFEKAKKPTPSALGKQLIKLQGMGVERAIKALDHSTTSNYQGVFEPTGHQVLPTIKEICNFMMEDTSEKFNSVNPTDMPAIAKTFMEYYKDGIPFNTTWQQKLLGWRV